MPRADLLFSRAEHEGLVQFVFELEAWLVPSRLPTASLIEIKDPESYRSYVDKGERLFHIQRRDFTRAPLEVRQVRATDDQPEVFYVQQRSGGPTVDLLGPYESEEGGQTRVASGFIGHCPTFWNPQSNEQPRVRKKHFMTCCRSTSNPTRLGQRQARERIGLARLLLAGSRRVSSRCRIVGIYSLTSRLPHKKVGVTG